MRKIVKDMQQAQKGNSYNFSQGGGQSPISSPDGTELFYRSNNEIVAVAIKTGPEFNPGKHDVLFKWSYQGNLIDTFSWDIHPREDRFLMIDPIEAVDTTEQIPRKIIIVTNWFKELKDRMLVD